MFVFLRILGITNAAIWMGAAFFNVIVAPAFCADVAQILPQSHSGAVAQLLLKRFFVVQSWCAAIAVIHLLAEWLYASRPLRKWMVYLLAGLLAFGLWGNFSLQPKLLRLHVEMHGVRSTPQQQLQAQKALAAWHGVARFSLFFALAGIVLYALQTTTAAPLTRFVRANKFQG